MRFLFCSTAGAGHFLPMVAFIRSCIHAGHDVLVAAPEGFGTSVQPTGAPFWPVGVPSPADLDAVFSRLPSLPREEANGLVIGEVFARLDAEAALPRLCEAITTWRPDVVIRESAELGAALAAELHGVPQIRIGIGLVSMEEVMFGYAAANFERLRLANGLPSDPDLIRLRETPYCTYFPASMEDAVDYPGLLRFRDPAWATAQARPERPFVYVTFGSVAGSIPPVAAAYGEAVAAVADLDADVLLTIGRHTDPAMLGTVPPNVRVEAWVDQASVLGKAAAVVCHGGGGSTIGALAAGAPLALVPLFSADQYINAAQVASVGAGVVATPDAAAIHSALNTVLTGQSYQDSSAAVAAELAGQLSTDEAPERFSRP
jgi:UDP:flavonoid glycosyltransferase YjiC (YdhE family)